MMQLMFVKICICIFLSHYHLFGLLMILVNKFMTYLTYLSNILGYFVAKDSIDMNI